MYTVRVWSDYYGSYMTFFSYTSFDKAVSVLYKLIADGHHNAHVMRRSDGEHVAWVEGIGVIIGDSERAKGR